ncbi:MAG: TMEM165/GDT1 family protein [Phycisphaerae bacterium]
MDLRTILSTFGIVFLAELGDKTQLSVLLLSAKSHRLWSVWVGASLALVLTTAIAVLLGYVGRTVIPVRLLHYVAAGGFIAIGVWLFLSKP